jgi:hypothetical protein
VILLWTSITIAELPHNDVAARRGGSQLNCRSDDRIEGFRNVHNLGTLVVAERWLSAST